MSYDDQLQSKNLKVIGIWPTNLEVIEGEVFFWIMRKAKRETTKDILAERKEKTGKSSSGIYKWYTCYGCIPSLVTQWNSWVLVPYWLVWSVIQNNAIQEYNGLSDWQGIW